MKTPRKKNSIELALSQTGLALHPRTPEEVSELEARHEQLTQLDAAIDKYAQDACSQGKTSGACQDANALVQGLKESYSDFLGQLTYKELNREDYAKVSQIVANTTADKWDYAIEGYAKSQNISYQEAKDKFALAININQVADVAGILYGLKGPEVGKGAVSSAAALLKTVLSKYEEFKQNFAASTKGNNDSLAMAGAGNVNSPFVDGGLPPNAYLTTGSVGKGNSVPEPTKASNGLSYQSNPKHTPGAKGADTLANAERGTLTEANFAQNKIKADRSFSDDGQKKYSELAGTPIKTVDDLAGALRAGTIKPNQLPIDYVDMNGTRLILNTRTSTALEQAAIPRNEWFGRNQTGVEAYPGKTFNDLAADQLKNNKLPPTGAEQLK